MMSATRPRLGMGIVGLGFVGVHHIEAVRRLGFVDVVAVAENDQATAEARAASVNVPAAYGDIEAFMADPAVQVVHVTTPNHLHAPVIRAAMAHGKHVISEKPLAMSAAEAHELLDLAQKAGVVHAVTFNYRGNPMLQQMRAAIADGAIGPVHFVHGAYLQDWLLEPTDYSWRLEPDKGGRSSAFADIGSHWCDAVQHVVGAPITEVLAELTTVVKTRYRPAVSSTFGTSGDVPREPVSIASEDLGSILVRFANGAKGCFSVGQVCAGHKNDFWFEVNGAKASLRWAQEQQNDVWVGSRSTPNQGWTKDPSHLLPAAQAYAHLPGGHQQGWADAFCNILRDIYGYIAAGGHGRASQPPAMATFADGCRAARIIDAVLTSHDQGGRWTPVRG